jgi:hypothetical protein
MRQELKTLRGGVIQGIGSGAYSLAMGGGVPGFLKGLSTELQRGEATRRSGTWAANIANTALVGSSIKGAEGAETVSGIAGAATKAEAWPIYFFMRIRIFA